MSHRPVPLSSCNILPCKAHAAPFCHYLYWCTGALDQSISSVCYWALQCYLAGGLLTLARTMSSWQAFGVGFWRKAARSTQLPASCQLHMPVLHSSKNNSLLLQIFTKRWRKGVWDLKAIVDSGGMPSSHSALCSVRSPHSQHACMNCSACHVQQYTKASMDCMSCHDQPVLPLLSQLSMQAITTATAMEFGLGSSLFAVSLAFSSIVMYDAAGVRRHAGRASTASQKHHVVPVSMLV